MSLICKYCRYDNTPLPEDERPDNCEGCGRDLEVAVTGRPKASMEDYI